MFKRLGRKQIDESVNSITTTRFKRTSDAFYGPSIPSEETSAFTKRIRSEESSMYYLFS